MQIDAHQYFRVYDPVNTAGLPAENDVPRRDFLPPDLQPELETAGIDGTVAVQADESKSGTEFLLGLADAYPFIRGIIGIVDFTDRSLYEHLEFFSQFERLKGFRHSTLPGAEALLEDKIYIKGVRQLAAFDFTFDLSLNLQNMEKAEGFAEQLPGNRVIVTPPTGFRTAGEPAGLQRCLGKLAALPNVYCKAPVLYPDASAATNETLAAGLDFVLETFGSERMVFGSGWPASLLRGSYPEFVAAVRTWSEKLSPDAQQRIFGANAQYFYNLES